MRTPRTSPSAREARLAAFTHPALSLIGASSPARSRRECPMSDECKGGLGFRGDARRAPQEGRQVVAEPDDARLGPVVRSGLARRAAARLGNGGAGRAGEGQHFGIMGFVMRLLAGFMASFLPRRPIVAARPAVALLGIARGP